MKTSHRQDTLDVPGMTKDLPEEERNAQNMDKPQSLETVTKTQKPNENVLKFNHS